MSQEENEEETPIHDYTPDKDVLGLDKPPAIPFDSETAKEIPELDAEYATLFQRLLAYVIDAIIIVGIVWFFAHLFGWERMMRRDHLYDQSLFSWLIWTIYYGVFESSAWQGTPGKKMMGIIVVDLYGEPLTFRKAVLHYLAQIISILPLGLGIISIARDAKKQAWHDMLVGCYVVVNPWKKD